MRTMSRGRSDALDSHRPLRVQLVGVRLVTLLLAVLQVRTVVALQHPMLAAEMAAAEAAVADDGGELALALVRCVFLVVARWLLGHAAAKREREV